MVVGHTPGHSLRLDNHAARAKAETCQSTLIRATSRPSASSMAMVTGKRTLPSPSSAAKSAALSPSTAAFAVILDRWVFNLPSFEVFGLFQINLFRNGSVAVDALDLFGQQFDEPDSQMILGAVCFALIARNLSKG